MQHDELSGDESKTPAGGQDETARYEAPTIESVITPEEMEREVAYAGFVAPSGKPR